MYIPRKIGALPVPFSDECLSSFLLRTAHRQGLSPHALCHILWPEYQFWPRDLDRCARPSLIEAISKRTGMSATCIERLTLRPLMKEMTAQIRRHGVSRWILPIGVYHRIRRDFGQRFCPECLAQSQRYLQRAWRIGYVSICSTHYRNLQDACPDCDAPFIPHRHGSLLLARCHSCGADLTKPSMGKVNIYADGLQMHLNSVRKSSAFPADEFSGWHTLMSILARNDARFKSQEGAWFMWRECERRNLLSASFELYQDWPFSFVKWAEDHRLSQAGLNDYRCQSIWLSSVISLLPERYSPPRKSRRKSPARPLPLSKSWNSGGGTKTLKATAMLNAAYRILRTKQNSQIK